ncbi:hypothetical protein J6590_065576 [Homalodisca vitripennis]|nr:hypothetical protein J6590_065576 [Homalodisca vitripennis]
MSLLPDVQHLNMPIQQHSKWPAVLCTRMSHWSTDLELLTVHLMSAAAWVPLYDKELDYSPKSNKILHFCYYQQEKLFCRPEKSANCESLKNNFDAMTLVFDLTQLLNAFTVNVHTNSIDLSQEKLPRLTDQCSDPAHVRYFVKNLTGMGSERNEHTCHVYFRFSFRFYISPTRDRHNCELAIVAICLDEEDQNNKQSFMKSSGKREYWVHDAWKTRQEEGEFTTLLPHLLDDETKFFHYFRMPMHTFNQLELKLKEHLTMQDTYFRKAITPRHRLAVFLR